MTAERSQHTPGRTALEFITKVDMMLNEGQPSNTLWNYCVEHRKSALSNATAAPELLEALTYIHDHARTGLDSGGNVYLQLNLVKQKAAQLLAKATGCAS